MTYSTVGIRYCIPIYGPGGGNVYLCVSRVHFAADSWLGPINAEACWFKSPASISMGRWISGTEHLQFWENTNDLSQQDTRCIIMLSFCPSTHPWQCHTGFRALSSKRSEPVGRVLFCLSPVSGVLSFRVLEISTGAWRLDFICSIKPSQYWQDVWGNWSPGTGKHPCWISAMFLLWWLMVLWDENSVLKVGVIACVTNGTEDWTTNISSSYPQFH